MARIINGQYFEDGKPGKRVINTQGGNYTEKVEGNFIQIQGNEIRSDKAQSSTPERKDLSKDGDVIDVKSEKV